MDETHGYFELLKSMCDSLCRRQIVRYGSPHDGAFLCDACCILHGRADNAVFPMLYLYRKTKDEKYLQCVRGLLRFDERLMQPDGAIRNDSQSEWKGTTVFAALYFCKSLLYFSDWIPEDVKKTMVLRLYGMSAWVHNNIIPGFRANSNYYAAASAVNALCGVYFKDEEYIGQAKFLLDYCLQLISENGFIAGEGQPHNARTVKKCIPVDMGYLLEETLPCLTEAAIVLHDESALRTLANSAKQMLAFILPDGGIDNSFGSRNNKWTYYGSRTCDGMCGAFLRLSMYEPELATAAVANADLIRQCYADGVLYGGREYRRLQQPGCVHHLFSHASGLCDALLAGLDTIKSAVPLPLSVPQTVCRYYPEIDSYRIETQNLIATVTGYDWRNYTYANGAAHTSGGMMSLLFHRRKGIAVAGSVYSYTLTEMTNMQLPQGDREHASLIPRLEYEKDGIPYTTCADPYAEIKAMKNTESIDVTVISHFVRIADWTREDNDLCVRSRYRFFDDSVQFNIELNKEKSGITLILPIIENTLSVQTEYPCEKRKIFFLTGGFGADAYVFPIEKKISLTIR